MNLITLDLSASGMNYLVCKMDCLIIFFSSCHLFLERSEHVFYLYVDSCMILIVVLFNLENTTSIKSPCQNITFVMLLVVFCAYDVYNIVDIFLHIDFHVYFNHTCAARNKLKNRSNARSFN
jgi:hypothetical protein